MFHFFRDIERLLRLNPQWAVIAMEGHLKAEKGSEFTAYLKYDRSDKEIRYLGKVEEYKEGELIGIRLTAVEMTRFFSFTIYGEGNESIINYRESNGGEPLAEEKREIIFWLRSIANYIIINEKKTLFSKVWKWFLDKVWLKMSPSGKRIALIIVLSEVLALFLFIIFLIYLMILK
ncbi:MAG: hypothetical protein N3A59_04590 [Thermodesulfovibrionales bacterium]|nr:hypothetical protein [Thermodesulfovibrionales bacterium]